MDVEAEIEPLFLRVYHPGIPNIPYSMLTML